MNILTSAFWGEGISDQRFLPVLIQRALEEIMLECAEGEWDIIEPIAFHPNQQASGFVEQIVDLSCQVNGFHVLFVHTDADSSDENDKALPFKIAPALKALEAVTPVEKYCREIVPIVPVFKIENWKLADSDALREALGTELSDEELGLNVGSKQLEEKSASKDLLAEILRITNQGRRIPVKLNDLDAALGKGISLKKSGLRQFTWWKFPAKSAEVSQSPLSRTFASFAKPLRTLRETCTTKIVRELKNLSVQVFSKICRAPESLADSTERYQRRLLA